MARKAKFRVKHRPQRDRLVHQVVQIIAGEKAHAVARKAHISPSTVAKWRINPKDCGTRYPQAYTMNQVLKAYGHELRVCPKQGWYAHTDSVN